MTNIKYNSIKQLEELFKKAGYEFTEQRKIIYSIMVENSGKHLSAKDICDISKKMGHIIGAATVYRTLSIMDKLDIITSFIKKDGINKYELYELNIDSGIYKHPHLICMKCGKIIGINENLLVSDLMSRIFKNYSFKIEDIRIELYGICENCKQKSHDRDLTSKEGKV